MAKRVKETHAGSRVVERGAGGLSLYDLQRHVRTRQGLDWLAKLSCTRSLVRIKGPEGWAYIIIQKERNVVVTVLTKEQAEATIGHPLDEPKTKETPDACEERSA
jgi:hypothetical protein